MSERPDHGEIYLNGKSYPVTYETYNQLATFPSKVTQGDFTRDSDQLISSKIWTDFSGGIGVRNIREGADDGSFYFGTLDPAKPYQLALPRKTVLTPEGPTMPLGMLDDAFLAGSLDTLYQWNEASGNWIEVGELEAVPQNKGLEFANKLFIPMGASGFQSWNGVDVGAIVADVKAVAFTEWNNMIWAICTDGSLQSSLNGADWDTHFQLNGSNVPLQIDTWLDADGDDAIYISTNKGIIGWDHYAGEMIATRLRFPRHPTNGRGLGSWRIGEDLFVSAGLQVYRFTINAISEMGPNKPNGLPAEYRGYIKDFEPEHNALYALIQGQAVFDEEDPEIAFDTSMTEEGEFTTTATRGASLLLKWVETGWHVAWVSPSPTTPNWTMVSAADQVYRVFWGTSDGIWTSTLPTTLNNPRELIEGGEGDFNTEGFLQTGNYDAGMRRFEKIASHLELTFTEFPAACSCEISYRVNEGDWHTMTPDAPWGVGTMTLPFRVETLDDGTIFSRGLIFDRIEFMIEMSTTDETLSPVLDSMVLKFIKRPLQTDSFILEIPLHMFEGEWQGRSILVMKQELDNLSNSGEFVRFQHGSNLDISHRVYLGNVNGQNESGDDPRGVRTVSLVEIPIPGGGYDGRL